MVVLGSLGLRAGSVVIAVLLFLGAVALGCVVVPIVLRRYSTGGVWLTPAGLVDRFRGTEVTLGWDDVAAVDYGRLDVSSLLGGAPSVLFGGEYPMVVRTRRPNAHTVTHLTPIWRSPRKPTAHAVYLEMPEIGVAPGTLARVIVHYAANPAARGELGTERSLQTIADVRDDSETPVFQLVVDARAGWGPPPGPVPVGGPPSWPGAAVPPVPTSPPPVPPS